MITSLPFDTFDLSEKSARSQLDWAIRRGVRGWLWPDIEINAWQLALTQIRVLTNQVLTGERAKNSLHGDPATIGVAAFTSGMGPLLGHWLGEGLIEADPAVAAVLDLHLRHNTARMELMASRATALVDELAARGVRVTVLKGMHTAYSCFPVPGTRPMSDIDLLVAPAEEARAAETLRALRFEPGPVAKMPPEQVWRMEGTSVVPRSLALVHAEDPWSVDLHRSLKRRPAAGAPVIDLDAMLQPDMMETWTLSSDANVLAPVALALHVASHTSAFENLTMLRLTELVFVVRVGAERGLFSWEAFVDAARRTAALGSVYPALYMAEQLARGTVPAEVLRAAKNKAPRKVHQVVSRLRPECAQKVLRSSLEERFMWTISFAGLVRQIALDFFPLGIPLRELISLYKARMWRMLRAKFSRRAVEGF